MTEKEVAQNKTKEKILSVSRSLFAKYGFDGTSIREIATQSDVNIAAVNYHFENKENLFWEIILEAYEAADREIARMSEQSGTVHELSMKIFDFFYSQSDLVRTTMRMIMTESIEPPKNSEVAARLNASFGPPGGRFIAEKIKKEIPFKFDDEGIYWGVKTIFGCITHWSMMCNMARVKKNHALGHLMEPKQIRKDVENTILSTVEYIKNHPELFNKGEGSPKAGTLKGK